MSNLLASFFLGVISFIWFLLALVSVDSLKMMKWRGGVLRNIDLSARFNT